MEMGEDIVFSRNTVEFVTVAAEYCAYIERCNEHSRKEFTETLLKLLPLLYLKAQMLPEGEKVCDDELEDFVTEDSYEVLRMDLYELFSDKDSYLDVFVAEMKYSDTPVTKSISWSALIVFTSVCPQYWAKCSLHSIMASCMVSLIPSLKRQTKFFTSWYMSARSSEMLFVTGVSLYFISATNTSR